MKEVGNVQELTDKVKEVTAEKEELQKENAALKHNNMLLSKLGALIDPLDIVFNGSKTLHGLDEGGVETQQRFLMQSMCDTAYFCSFILTELNYF